jgi:hypothetical protein
MALLSSDTPSSQRKFRSIFLRLSEGPHREASKNPCPAKLLDPTFRFQLARLGFTARTQDSQRPG